MKTKLLALLFLAGTAVFAGPRIFVGVGGGGYAPIAAPLYAPPAVPVSAYVPAAPGPGYSWIAGYWYPAGPRWAWHSGYWVRPPYARSYWVAPRYFGGRFYAGRWRRR